jgi:hypothetical protein
MTFRGSNGKVSIATAMYPGVLPKCVNIAW